MIYLDNAATTFPKPEEVYQRVDYVQRNLAVNIGRGSYKVANEAMQVVDETRYLMAKLVHVDNPGNVVFTPSATIAANEVILGLEWDSYKTVYVTPFEHNAIARPLHFIQGKYGIRIHMLPFDTETHKFDIESAETMFSRQEPDYVFVNQVSNVTGTILPVREISKLAKKFEAKIIVDASQSIGLLDIDMFRDGIDYLIFAGHKNLYASLGIGGFISRMEPELTPVLTGGTGSNSLNLSMGSESPICFEPASPNITAIASLNTSMKWLDRVTIDVISDRKKQLCDMLIGELRRDGCKLYLPSSEGIHTSVVSFNVDSYQPYEAGIILSEDFDIAVRTGFHCAPYIHDFLGTKKTGGTIRASVSYFNSEEDIMALASAIKEL